MALSAGIDDLKASIGRRGGLARDNRFVVYFAHPGKKGGLLGGLLPTTGFEISGVIGNIARSAFSGGGINLGGFISDPRDLSMLIETAQIPGKTISTVERYTDMKAKKVPYAFINDDASFSFICTNDYYPYKYFSTWMDSVIQKEPYRVRYKEEYTTDITIQQMGNTDFIPVHGVRLVNAYPIGITEVNLGNAENSISKFTVQMAYDYHETEGLIEGAIGAIGRTVAGNIAQKIGKIF